MPQDLCKGVTSKHFVPSLWNATQAWPGRRPGMGVTPQIFGERETASFGIRGLKAEVAVITRFSKMNICA